MHKLKKTRCSNISPYVTVTARWLVTKKVYFFLEPPFTRLQALWVVLFVFRRFFCAFFQDVDRYLPTRFAKNTATSLAITFKISIAIVKSISMRSPPFSIKWKRKESNQPPWNIQLRYINYTIFTGGLIAWKPWYDNVFKGFWGLKSEAWNGKNNIFFRNDWHITLYIIILKL